VINFKGELLIVYFYNNISNNWNLTLRKKNERSSHVKNVTK
jgi:hypothetical protein